MALRGIIFDMGGTLLNYTPPDAQPQTGWQAMENAGAQGLHEFLKEQGYTIPALEKAQALNFAIMEKHWRQIGTGEGVNPQLGPILSEVMTSWGIPADHLQDGLVDSAVAAYVTPVQAFVAPLAGARETLAALQAQGLPLGLISNTVWPGAFHLEDLERWELAPYFECMLFSADVGVWKPATAIFNTALEMLNLAPDEAAYIGDHPYFDVYGAQQAGLKGVWMWSAEWEAWQPADFTITPDATLKALPDLLDVVAAWQG